MRRMTVVPACAYRRPCSSAALKAVISVRSALPNLSPVLALKQLRVFLMGAVVEEDRDGGGSIAPHHHCCRHLLFRRLLPLDASAGRRGSHLVGPMTASPRVRHRRPTAVCRLPLDRSSRASHLIRRVGVRLALSRSCRGNGASAALSVVAERSCRRASHPPT